MATYKVIQDIEAEDKLIGPFGIRQFIYLIIVAVSGFLAFQIALVAWFLAIPLLPHTIFFALLALPFGGEQPTETWLLAKIRFAMKPRRRIWNQSGIQNLVTITAPKKIEKVLTDSMTETQVRSRLEALANTIDSRGWAIKNVNVNVFSQPAYATAGSSSDRLIDASSMAQQVPSFDINATDDMMDAQNNPTAQNLDRMISASTRAYREKIVNSMQSPQTQTAQPSVASNSDGTNNGQPPVQPDYWFLNSNAGAAQTTKQGMSTFQSSNLVTPDPSAFQQQSNGLPLAPLAPPSGPITEEELLDRLHKEKKKKPKRYGNMHVVKTLEDQQAEAKAKAEAESLAASKPPEPPMTPAPDPDIIELARNDDLNVETVARQAKKSKDKDLSDGGEVVINLH